MLPLSSTQSSQYQSCHLALTSLFSVVFLLLGLHFQQCILVAAIIVWTWANLVDIQKNSWPDFNTVNYFLGYYWPVFFNPCYHWCCEQCLYQYFRYLESLSLQGVLFNLWLKPLNKVSIQMHVVRCYEGRKVANITLASILSNTSCFPFLGSLVDCDGIMGVGGWEQQWSSVFLILSVGNGLGSILEI